MPAPAHHHLTGRPISPLVAARSEERSGGEADQIIDLTGISAEHACFDRIRFEKMPLLCPMFRLRKHFQAFPMLGAEATDKAASGQIAWLRSECRDGKVA